MTLVQAPSNELCGWLECALSAHFSNLALSRNATSTENVYYLGISEVRIPVRHDGALLNLDFQSSIAASRWLTIKL